MINWSNHIPSILSAQMDVWHLISTDLLHELHLPNHNLYKLHRLLTQGNPNDKTIINKKLTGLKRESLRNQEETLTVCSKVHANHAKGCIYINDMNLIFGSNINPPLFLNRVLKICNKWYYTNKIWGGGVPSCTLPGTGTCLDNISICQDNL